MSTENVISICIKHEKMHFLPSQNYPSLLNNIANYKYFWSAFDFFKIPTHCQAEMIWKNKSTTLTTVVFKEDKEKEHFELVLNKVYMGIVTYLAFCLHKKKFVFLTETLMSPHPTWAVIQSNLVVSPDFFFLPNCVAPENIHIHTPDGRSLENPRE